MRSYQFNLPFKRQEFFHQANNNHYRLNLRQQYVPSNIKRNNNQADNDHSESIIRQRIKSYNLEDQKYSESKQVKSNFEKKSSFIYNQKNKDYIKKIETKIEDLSLQAVQKKHNLLKQTCKIQRQKNFNKNQQIMIEKQKYYKLTEQIKKLQKDLKEKKNKKQKLQQKFHQVNLFLRQNKQNLRSQNEMIQEENAYIQQINAKINFFKKQNMLISQKLIAIEDAEEKYQYQKELNQQLMQKLNKLQNQQREIQKQIGQQMGNIQHLENQVDNLASLYEEKIEKVINLRKDHKRLKQFDRTKFQNETCLQQLQKTIRKLQLEIGAKNQKILYTNTEIYQLNSKISREKKKIKNFYQNLKKGKQLVKSMEIKNSEKKNNLGYRIKSPEKSMNNIKYKSKQLKNQLNSAIKIKNWQKIMQSQQSSKKSIEKNRVGKTYQIIDSENENALNLRQEMFNQLKTKQHSNKKIQQSQIIKPMSTHQIKSPTQYQEQSSISSQQIYGLDMLINQYENIKSKSSFNKTQNRQQY